MSSLHEEVLGVAYFLVIILCILLGLTLILDYRRIEGMAKDEMQIIILWAMYNYPTLFHYFFCVEREQWIGRLYLSDRRDDPNDSKAIDIAGITGEKKPG